MRKKQTPISVTGIKPTGTPHLGNYLGAIKPAIELSQNYQSFLFIADYHALTSTISKEELSQSTLAVAATWIACGIDPNEVVFYRQSDIPELFEIHWILSCMAPKGLLNRAHAYKNIKEQNIAENRDEDDGINLGLYSYPVLMAADILSFGADIVPVGKDQQQHVEIARDLAQSCNKRYNSQIKVPKAIIQDKSIPGIDGQKMSKSYGNIIPLFASEKSLKKSVMKIKTDSKEIDEIKDPDSCLVFELYKSVAQENEIAELKARYLAPGMGYGHAKVALFEALLELLGPFQDKYNAILADTALSDILNDGQKKARQVAQNTLEMLRQQIGIQV